MIRSLAFGPTAASQCQPSAPSASSSVSIRYQVTSGTMLSGSPIVATVIEGAGAGPGRLPSVTSHGITGRSARTRGSSGVEVGAAVAGSSEGGDVGVGVEVSVAAGVGGAISVGRGVLGGVARKLAMTDVRPGP